MAENKLIIGSLPVLRGAYDSATNYYRDNQVTMYGSTFQSLVDENVGYPPAELREDGKVYAINTDKWIIVANAIDAYNAGERIANAEARIKELGEYADSPEFIRTYTDAEGKFLWGIRADGTVEWAKGVPTPIQNAIRELKDKLETQDIKSLQDAIDVINASLKTLTDTLSYQDNPEFVDVVTDVEGKVLFGIKTDGSPYYPNNEMYHVIQSNEYLAAWVDASGKLLFGIKVDGSIYIAKSEYIDAVKEIQEKLIEIEAITENFEVTDNPEYIAAVTDNEGKVLEVTQADGKKYFPKQALLDKYDDVEGRTEITLDAEDRVLAYRDKEGIKHESKLDVDKIYQNGTEVGEIASKDDIKDFATKEEVENITIDPSEINIAELEGVSDHNTPNLLIASEMQKTFNDGTNSFTPPNVGYEMSNPIECQAGDWFTRTGTATGMVVVTDENDKNGTRLFNADGTTLGNTFQVPTSMTWIRYIRMAAEVGGAEDGSVVICKGKVAYTGDNKGDYFTVDRLRVQNNNIPKDIKYLKSPDGKYWEMYVDESHQLQIREIDPDVITELPSDFKPWTLTGTFDGKFDRMLLQNTNYFIEIKASGVVKYKNIGSVNNGNFANFEHFYSPTGDDRYGFIFHTSDSNVIGKRFTLFDGEFNILDTNVGLEGYNGTTPDMHDFVYINDEHIILCSATYSSDINVPGSDGIKNITTGAIYELKKIDGIWTVVGTFYPKDYPALCTDAFGNPDNTIGSHWNTVGLDYDGNLIVNYRNWETWIKIKRTENSDGTVTLGSKTLDYDEAIIGRVGGRHNSGYLDSKRVLNDGFSFTDTPNSLDELSDDAWEEWQFFHCHDVKYWGMKQIGDKQYPTYTLFDNNYWTGNNFGTSGYNVPNRNNNIDINPQGDGSYYQESKDGNENYAKYQHSRVIQMSIDWENHKVMDYRVYYIPKLYSKEQGGATMYDEGIISIAYSYAGEFGLWDFTTGETEVSGHIYKGAKQLFLGKYDIPTYTYRANTYKLNN